MAVYKCKICGGDLEIREGMGICECMYCGTKQTLPKINDERRANLYDRANHFRRNNEFDKAMSMYEQILEEDKEDAEAYWSLVLCTYGIEYVEDPVSHKRMPTVNRTQYTSVFADENYKAALRYADGSQRQIYEEEAKQIDEIQKGILDISNQEEPYDVFICYKETDQSGKRTPDSVLANDLYHQLTQEGFKVFFARITLEDKLGSAYEPYIFAALNSAKVMVVIGTKAEYFNAVWVKNEWSRYLSLIKNGAKKVLIPAYKDMDPYDMPQEFSHLQSQDMSKLGFMQDLLRGIKKLTGMDGAQSNTGNAGVSKNDESAALLKRAFLFLEDGDFTRADEFCENVLNIDPENGEAYLGKLMVGLRIGKREELAQSEKRLDQIDEFSKIMRFGSEALKAEVNGYNQKVIERQEKEAERQRQLREQEAERQRQLKAEQDEQDYQKAIAEIQKAKKSFELKWALDQLREMSTYKDAAVHITLAETKLEKFVKAERKRKRKLAAVSVVAAMAAVIAAVVLGIAIKNSREEAYRRNTLARAVELIQNGRYEDAYNTLGGITANTAECDAVWIEEMLVVVMDNFENEQYETALEIFEYAENRMTSETQEEAKDALYAAAKEYIEKDRLEEVDQVFKLLISKGFMDSETLDKRDKELVDSLYAAAKEYIEKGRLEEAEQALGIMTDRGLMGMDEERYSENIYNLAKGYFGEGEYAKSYDLFSSLNDYADSEEILAKTSFLMQVTNAEVGDVVTFGRYKRLGARGWEQGEIEWYILDIQDNEYLLFSKNQLGSVEEDYLVEGDSTSKNTFSWENSAARSWMNETFYQDAFNSAEKKCILSKTIKNDSVVIQLRDDGGYDYSIIDTGNDTVDKVFTLSISEINENYVTQKSKKSIREDQGGRLVLSIPSGVKWGTLNRYMLLRTLMSDGNRFARTNDSYTEIILYGDLGRGTVSYNIYPAIWVKIDAALE